MSSKGGITKGAPFEREICKELSLWWSDGKDEDIFWRTEGSGARATSVGKKGRDLPFSHGDVTFKDPIGRPFIDMFFISLKRGYSNKLDLLGLIDSTAKNMLLEWIDEAQNGQYLANRSFYLIIVRRDRRKSFVVTNFNFWAQIGLPKEYFIYIKEQPIYLCSSKEFFFKMAPRYVKTFIERRIK